MQRCVTKFLLNTQILNAFVILHFFFHFVGGTGSRVSLCTRDWPGNCYVCQSVLFYTEIHLALPQYVPMDFWCIKMPTPSIVL